MAVAPEKTAARQLLAAHLSIATNWKDEQLAAHVGVAVKTLQNWRAQPAYQALLENEKRAALDAMRGELLESITKAGAGVQEARLADYNLIRGSLLGVIADRQADAAEQLAAWSEYEAKREALVDAIAICQDAVNRGDPDEKNAVREAKADLREAEANLDRHIRWNKVDKPPRAAPRGVVVRDVKSVGKVAVEVWKLDEALLRSLMAADKQAAQDLGQWLEKLKINVGDLDDAQILNLLGGGDASDA